MARASLRSFSDTPAITRRSLSTLFDTPHIFRVSAYADEQTTSAFFESLGSRPQFLATHRVSAAARYLLTLNVRESTWGFSEVGNAFSRSVRPLRESARAFCRSARPHRRWTGIFLASPASLRRSAATHRLSPCARNQSEATYFDNDTSHDDNPDHLFSNPFPSRLKGQEREPARPLISPRRRVLWIHIDANASRLTAREPCRERSQELTGDSGAATSRDQIHPFQLSVATEASREMSRDEADNVLPAFGDEDHPRRQGLLRM